MANYMIWKSNGKPNVLLIKNTDLYIVSHGQYLGTTEVLNDKAACAGCKSVTREYALANLDTQPASVALAALQGDPSIDWVWCFDSCMSRVARSLVASGIGSKVRGAGFDCNGENVQLIQQGQIQAVCAADPRDWEGYALVDNLNRMLHGQSAVEQNIPIRMFDKDTIGRLSPNEVQHGWQGDFDFRSQYKKLWGVS
ncbi:sugar ABC transporter substrate-binding protein [Sphingobium olei]|uniref:Sugar ABC transporter substrate-binding protein n=1 Tax=Sphingobium olei TaxID=420955 RepID=A0ABW3NY37_9SPHN